VIKRGTGELEGVAYESVTYEGYAPHGVALYVETLTDNRNRTASEIRTILTKNGGSLAEPGSVAWQFERKGIVSFANPIDEESVMEATLEVGAEDLVKEGESWRLTCSPSDLPVLREALEEAQISFESADVTMLASSTVEVTDPQEVKAVLKLVDLLDEDDDVQDVYANFDIPDDVLENLQL
jgi:YebC/PmpR family DNA-binding regulatory protein